MNAEAIQRVAQSMPSHMLHSLSQVANQTPHYAHTPGGPGFTGAAGYAFANTVNKKETMCSVSFFIAFVDIIP
jgi:hypothetical protein